jgi:predicted house-cleaning noncanonical NTP pyrophosphatase (MazG superfamily)
MNTTQQATASELADELEHHMEEELDRIITKSFLFHLADSKIHHEIACALNSPTDVPPFIR